MEMGHEYLREGNIEVASLFFQERGGIGPAYGAGGCEKTGRLVRRIFNEDEPSGFHPTSAVGTRTGRADSAAHEEM